MSTYEKRCQEDARLAILGELAKQRDATLNSRLLCMVVDQLVPRRTPEWVENQLRWLESINAINLKETEITSIGRVLIATLTATGRNHVERRVLLSGVSNPADED